MNKKISTIILTIALVVCSLFTFAPKALFAENLPGPTDVEAVEDTEGNLIVTTNDTAWLEGLCASDDGDVGINIVDEGSSGGGYDFVRNYDNSFSLSSDKKTLTVSKNRMTAISAGTKQLTFKVKGYENVVVHNFAHVISNVTPDFVAAFTNEGLVLSFEEDLDNNLKESLEYVHVLNSEKAFGLAVYTKDLDLTNTDKIIVSSKYLKDNKVPNGKYYVSIHAVGYPINGVDNIVYADGMKDVPADLVFNFTNDGIAINTLDTDYLEGVDAIELYDTYSISTYFVKDEHLLGVVEDVENGFVALESFIKYIEDDTKFAVVAKNDNYFDAFYNDAEYDFDKIKYSIKYNLGSVESDGKDKGEYAYGKDFVLPELTPKDIEHYEFAGWYEDEDFTKGPVTKVKAGEIGNKVFFAKWEYIMLDGKEETWAKTSSYTEDDVITFRSAAEFDDFKRLEIDGKVVEKEYYNVKEGSTIIELKVSYVAKNLSKGDHEIAIISKDGVAAYATLTIKSKHKPSDDKPLKVVSTGIE